ncbi:MAG: AMP-dependent synthetase/ligase [Micrococcales bacterium]|nr:AMP-dependent synthetase/ligase [Micrococcales bacterium]
MVPIVRQFTTPAYLDHDPGLSIGRLIENRCLANPEAVQATFRQGDVWVEVSAAQFVEEVNALAKGLIAAGIDKGETVGIMGRTSYQWTLIDVALWSIGAVGVPIYQTSSVDQAGWICQDASLKAVFAELDEQAEVIAGIGHFSGQVWVWAQDGLDQLVKAGQSVSDAQLAARAKSVTGDDLATVIYTSGTTGRPKGVELTHSNFVTLTRNAIIELWFICKPGRRMLMFLPLAHVFARLINVILLASPAVAGYSPDTSRLLEDMQTFRPTAMLVVPRVLEKVYNSAEAATGGGFKRKLFRLAAKVSMAYSREQDRGGPSPARRLQHAVFKTLVYRKLTAKMGGQLTCAVAGGAPLGPRLGHFFRGIGLEVFEGYGLTETTAPTAVNREFVNKIGTVGLPLPGQSVAVADDGEVLVRGPHVFLRYRNNPEATEQAFRDGWFLTGDVGSLDADGYLSITGRRKELIVTASGKNVAPAVLEDRLRGHPLVSQVVVVGDDRPFVAALVTLDAEMLPGWLTSHNKSPLTLEQAIIDPDIRASLDRAVRRTNRAVSRAESIRDFVILPEDFTETNGYLTPSMKVKRSLVLHDYAGAIDQLYLAAAARRGEGNLVEELENLD